MAPSISLPVATATSLAAEKSRSRTPLGIADLSLHSRIPQHFPAEASASFTPVSELAREFNHHRLKISIYSLARGPNLNLVLNSTLLS